MTRTRWIGALALVALLAACGGGGGGGGGNSDGGSGSPPVVASSTGLVPAAPAAGQVLVADSAALRPLSAGLSWYYRQFTPFVGRTRVTMLAGTAGGVIERTSTATVIDAELSRTELSRNAAGQTVGSIVVPLDGGRSVTISGVELPRELRAGQQFTFYDSRTEGIDIAIWRVVADFESLVVPASPTPLRALRIDDRATVCSGTQTTQLYGSTWYAPDIGIVRSVVWTDATRTASESDDRLLGFDGVSCGFGAIITNSVDMVSARSEVLDDGFITLNNTDTTLADRNGKRVATGSIVRAPEEPYEGRLLPTSAGLRVASLARFASSSIFNLDALDASGRLQGARLGTLPVQTDDTFLQSVPGYVALVSHRASPVIWMSYLERATSAGGRPIHRLVVQRFDPAGQPLGGRLQWDVPSSTQFIPQVEVLPGELVLVQREGVQRDGGAQEPERFRVLAIANDGTVRSNRAYQLSDVTVPAVRLIVDGAARWLAWKGDDGLPRAWRLGADGAPVGVAETVASAQAALVPLPTSVHDQWPWAVVAAGGRWTIAGGEFASLTGSTSTPGTRHSVLALFDPGEGDVRNQPAPGLIRLDTGLLVGTARQFSDRTLWTVFSSPDPQETAVIQWR